jgi:hypothetical protein
MVLLEDAKAWRVTCLCVLSLFYHCFLAMQMLCAQVWKWAVVAAGGHTTVGTDPANCPTLASHEYFIAKHSQSSNDKLHTNMCWTTVQLLAVAAHPGRRWISVQTWVNLFESIIFTKERWGVFVCATCMCPRKSVLPNTRWRQIIMSTGRVTMGWIRVGCGT